MKTILKLVFLSFFIIVGLNFLNKRNIDVITEGKNIFNRFLSQIDEYSIKQTDTSASTKQKSVSEYTYNAYPSSPEIHQSEGFSQSEVGIELTEMTSDFVEFRIPLKNESLKSRFQELDKHAGTVPPQNKSSLFDLVNYLVSPATNDLEKARLIFTWIALNISYDDNGYNTGNYSDCSAEGVLQSGIAVCEGYSKLFEQMGKLAGLDIVQVIGYSKGISYRDGSAFDDTNHAWNAVKSEGQWRLFDVTWAAGYGKGINGKLVSFKKFNDFWFDVDPSAFIFSHLPEDSQWQLTDPEISKSQFENFPYADNSFFKMGFDGPACLQNVLNGTITDFPKTYGIDGEVHATSLPSQEQVRSGNAYKLSLTSAEAVDMAVINNKEWVHLKKNGNEFSTIIRPRSGKLSVNVKFPNDGSHYQTILQYSVN